MNANPEEQPKTMKNTLCCLLQNRLGAMDRVLNALTHRGYLPERMVSTCVPGTDRIQLMVTFECDGEKALEKLVKFLHKQIYVIEIQWMLGDSEELVEQPARIPNMPRLMPVSVPVTSNHQDMRRVSNGVHG
jgi:acetolactate synthase regulatory subunit